MTGSRDSSHFAALYESSPDPWGFADDPYERAKYQHSIDVLGSRGHFSAGLEVGCSIGVLTRLLAPRCETLLGVDLVDQPLRVAVERCADQPWVSFRRMQVPAEWPDQRFDLIVLSEVLYFLSPDDIDRLVGRVTGSLLPQGRVVLVNWLGESDDPMTGDAAAERFISASASGLTVTVQARRPRYRLDLLIGG
jgi:predicted TPR repeat methyltransferase